MEALTPGEAKSRQFRFARKGYDPLDVADFVDEVCQTLAMHVANEASLTEQLETARRRIAEVQGESERGQSEVQQAREAAQAELAAERERIEQQAQQAYAQAEAERQQWAAQAEAERAQWRQQVEELTAKLAENTTPPPAPDITPTALELLRTAQETAQKVVEQAEVAAREIIDETNADLVSTQERIATLKEKEQGYRSLLLEVLDQIRESVSDPTSPFHDLDLSGTPYVSARLAGKEAPQGDPQGSSGEAGSYLQSGPDGTAGQGDADDYQWQGQAAEAYDAYASPVPGSPATDEAGSGTAAEGAAAHAPQEQPQNEQESYAYSISYTTETSGQVGEVPAGTQDAESGESSPADQSGEENAANRDSDAPPQVDTPAAQPNPYAYPENPDAGQPAGNYYNPGGLAQAASSYLGRFGDPQQGPVHPQDPAHPGEGQGSSEPVPAPEAQDKPAEDAFNPHPWGS